jgi:tetratricopeptide (TPR) repeat protein
LENTSVISSYLKQKKTQKARKLIEVSFKDNLKLYFYYLGLSYCAEKEYSKAIVYLNLSKDHGLRNHLLYYNLGVSFLGHGDLDMAEKHFSESLNLNRDFINSYINLAYISNKKGDNKKAYRIIKSALAVSDDSELQNIEKRLLKCCL